jgi:hypothetical protein
MLPVLSYHLLQAINNHRSLEDATSVHLNLDPLSNNKSYLVPGNQDMVYMHYFKLTRLLDKLKETGKKKEGKEVFLDGQMTNRNVNK